MRLRPQSIYQWTRGKSLWNHFNSFSFAWSNKKHQLFDASPFSFYRRLFLSCWAAINYNNYFKLIFFFGPLWFWNKVRFFIFASTFCPVSKSLSKNLQCGACMNATEMRYDSPACYLSGSMIFYVRLKFLNCSCKLLPKMRKNFIAMGALR